MSDENVKTTVDDLLGDMGEPMSVVGTEESEPGSSQKEPVVEKVEAPSEEPSVDKTPESKPAEIVESAETLEAQGTESVSEMEALREQLAEMSKIVQEQQAAIQKGEVEAAPEIKFEDQAFVNAESIDEVLSSPETFNTLLNSVYRQGVAFAREAILKEIPEVIKPMVRGELDERRRIESFYDANEDLRDKRDYVSYVAGQLLSEHSDWDYNQLLEELGSETRRRLGISTQTTDPKPAEEAVPAFAGSGGSRKPTPRELSQTEQDVLDLISG